VVRIDSSQTHHAWKALSKFTDWRKRIPQCLQMLLLDAKRIENDII